MVTSDGGAPIEIATSPVINATDSSIDFLVKEVDVLAVLKKPFILTIYGNLNGNIPTLPMDLKLESGIEITLSPF